MTRTVIGLFDDFEHAQAAVRDLVKDGIPREHISLMHAGRKGEYEKLAGKDLDVGEGTAAGAATGAAIGGLGGLLVGLGALTIPGIGPLIAAGPIAAALAGAATGAVAGGLLGALADMGVPEEDAEFYAESVRRGGALVTVQTDETHASRAAEIMQRHGAVDTERRSRLWREKGWTGFDTTRTAPYDAKREMTFPVVEEELQVGKRDVERGGVRVYTTMRETPVAKDVTLREEHVSVDRRPVDRPASESDLTTFREGTLEVTEHVEKPVVSKEARVVEEVIVRKDVDERTERVEDTVRQTDVEVEQMSGRGQRRQDYNTYISDFRSNYQSRYAKTKHPYDYYDPAYRYGYTLATDQRYKERDWNTFEPEARRTWERDHPDSAWEDFKDAVRYAWDRVRGRA